MGQEPNIELSESDLPRRTPQPAAARRWRPSRPGEIHSPDDMAAGGAFGRPAADAGYALRLVAEAEFERGRNGATLEQVLATIASARASLFGRAPIKDDVEVAATLMGLRPEGVPEHIVEELGDARTRALARAAHERVKGRAVLERLAPGLLKLNPAELRAQLIDERHQIR